MSGVVMVMRRSGLALKSEGRQLLWWSGRRGVSSFDDKGRVLGEEELSREAVYMRQRDLELLEKLRKQAEKFEKIKRVLAEYKEGHKMLENWLQNTKLDKYEQK
ncbi:hypothetical protein GOP47_0008494 [Adiantum capillus-veneris]|uniref:Uncharacterized protein n=1 Tax=Adiantum capillus-veneris TaxID=13818 RepID=A0A9D4UYN8_ADICA|nr:hypothetical protein GOP47_0008494 [Adiantum capillus-veneris]